MLKINKMKNIERIEMFDNNTPPYPTDDFSKMTSYSNASHNIAKAQSRMIILSEANIEDHIRDANKIAEAFSKDSYVFETESAQERFFEGISAINKYKLSPRCLGFLEHSQDGSNDSQFGFTDCIVCLGQVSKKIENAVRGMRAKSYFGSVNYDQIASIQKRGQQTPSVTSKRKPLPI